ncbi:acylneuraminate cytidylyltransferase family protein [bacterium D16-51]|nr:acylneuraminate cytidylyltransferase family protein [bacterium D16-59]RKI55891.1 acylneuraminate cytidylyltransferase family protein [bacterium D16-51]
MQKLKSLAVIPARSGSKGLYDKNIKLLNGKPLLAYTIDAALNSGIFDRVMVSTDSEAYAGIAKKYGAEVPFLRSEENSADMVSSWDVVKEVLRRYLEEFKIQFSDICLLQPTSPLRTGKDIIDGYSLYRQKNAGAVTSVCECEHPPAWSMVLPEDGSLKEFRKNLISMPRQGYEKYYRLNGAFYIRGVSYEDGIKIIDNREFACVMERNHSVDIDTIEDFEYAEFLIDNKKVDEGIYSIKGY